LLAAPPNGGCTPFGDHLLRGQGLYSLCPPPTASSEDWAALATGADNTRGLFIHVYRDDLLFRTINTLCVLARRQGLKSLNRGSKLATVKGLGVIPTRQPG